MLDALIRNTLSIKAWQWVLVVVFFMCLQWHKAAHLAPAPEYIWDNVYLWDWARSIVYGKWEDFAAHRHHNLRWGNWGFATFLIAAFSDDVIFYYLSTLIPSTLAGLTFSYIAWRYIGFFPALVFCLCWYFDRELFRATFSLLPTGAGLLPTAICLLLLMRIIDKGHLSTAMAVSVSLVCFWIYGAKEPFLAFVPGVLFVLWRYGGWRSLAIFSAVCASGYVIETAFFRSISTDFSLLGRVWMLIHNGHHIGLMFENAGLVAQQTRYPDAGLTLRWITPLGTTMILFFPAFIFGLLAMANQSSSDGQKVYRPHHAIALMLLSFIAFTSFFIISISPLRLGQPLVSRYVAICIPFAYLMILWFCKHHFSATQWRFKIALGMMLPFFFSHSYHRMAAYPDASISQHARAYENYGEILDNYDCIQSKELSIARNRLDLIPLESRTEKVSSIINNPNHRPAYGGGFTISVLGEECTNPWKLGRTELMRY